MTQTKTFPVRDSQYQFSNSKMATFFFPFLLFVPFLLRMVRRILRAGMAELFHLFLSYVVMVMGGYLV